MNTTQQTLSRLIIIVGNHIDFTDNSEYTERLIDRYCQYTIDLAREYETNECN